MIVHKILNSDLQRVKPSTRSKELMVDNSATDSNSCTAVILNNQTFINLDNCHVLQFELYEQLGFCLCNRMFVQCPPTYDKIKLSTEGCRLIDITPEHHHSKLSLIECYALWRTCILLRFPQMILTACLWGQDRGSPCCPMAASSTCFSPSNKI